MTVPSRSRLIADEAVGEWDLAITAQQERFIVEYLKLRKGAEAARRAGYSEHTAKVQASRLLTNANLLAEIERRTKANGMGLDEAVSRLSDIGRGTMEDFVSLTYEPYPVATLDLGKARERDVLHLIKKLKYDKDGNPEIELYSAADANKFIAELHSRGPSGKEDDPFHIVTRKVIEGPDDVR